MPVLYRRLAHQEGKFNSTKTGITKMKITLLDSRDKYLGLTYQLFTRGWGSYLYVQTKKINRLICLLGISLLLFY